jgi:hypothetical protein
VISNYRGNNTNTFEDLPKQNPNMTYQYEGSSGLMMGGNSNVIENNMGGQHPNNSMMMNNTGYQMQAMIE